LQVVRQQLLEDRQHCKARPGFEAAYAKEGFLGTVKQTAQNYFGSPVDTAKQMYGTDGFRWPGTASIA
jgi:hypothetical protein